ncbi:MULTISPECIES: DUF3455 domain-containing protein [unclassified Pseudomonas]|uniref:DUF3455 domain-containing protein n=1 Tax=unclassified Pseudomonas TaxID=196821 RepID=UPI0015A03669|nr:MULTISPECIES: DUF3455 domain-containing protein [unclassified Pseudomonas]NWC95448.1 DUF3455 domain-containing protein [Pseudomonas sp. IPO3779]NWD17352.1 DUF3455 domain-containing protein [Pseudomonas sp. IPO3778]
MSNTDPEVLARRHRLALLALQVIGLVVLIACAIDAQRAQAQDLPDPLSGDAKTVLMTVQAEGVQIYNCAKDSGGQLTWQFREPLATLMINGKTVGRHFAGPTWQLNDRSAVVGKVVAQVPGATARDIALLRLDVVSHQGVGGFSPVVAVQRLHTEGGVFSGSCEHDGDLHVEPYRADYRFLGQ